MTKKLSSETCPKCGHPMEFIVDDAFGGHKGRHVIDNRVCLFRQLDSKDAEIDRLNLIIEQQEQAIQQAAGELVEMSEPYTEEQAQEHIAAIVNQYLDEHMPCR